MSEQALTEALEALVDKSSLASVLEALSLICLEKAEHLQTNWQDKNAAKTWERDANRLDVVAQKIEN